MVYRIPAFTRWIYISELFHYKCLRKRHSPCRKWPNGSKTKSKLQLPYISSWKQSSTDQMKTIKQKRHQSRAPLPPITSSKRNQYHGESKRAQCDRGNNHWGINGGGSDGEGGFSGESRGVGVRLKRRGLLDGCGAPRGYSPLLQAVGPTPTGILILRNCFVWKLKGEVDGADDRKVSPMWSVIYA